MRVHCTCAQARRYGVPAAAVRPRAFLPPEGHPQRSQWEGVRASLLWTVLRSGANHTRAHDRADPFSAPPVLGAPPPLTPLYGVCATGPEATRSNCPPTIAPGLAGQWALYEKRGGK